MNSKSFLSALRREAKKVGFLSYKSGWILEKTEADECRVAMSCTKSRWGESHMLMIKVYIVGAFGWTEHETASMFRENGHVFRSTPPLYSSVFDLESGMSDADRIAALAKVFAEFVEPFINLARTRVGLKTLESDGKVYILPAVQEEIQRLAA